MTRIENQRVVATSSHIVTSLVALALLAGCTAIGEQVQQDAWRYVRYVEGTSVYSTDYKKELAARYRDYIGRFPNAPQINEARFKLDKLHAESWVAAAATNKTYSYRRFLDAYPDSIHRQIAMERLNYLTTRRAIVEIEYPAEIAKRTSPYSNVGGPLYLWHTVFKETGGNAGFRVSLLSHYYVDSKGNRSVLGGPCTPPNCKTDRWDYAYTYGSEGNVKVPSGGSRTDSTNWINNSGFSGGHFYGIWKGEDDSGNYIELTQIVNFK